VFDRFIPARNLNWPGASTVSLFERWHPVTRDFGLIRTPVHRLVSELEAWHGSFGTTYGRSEITSSFGDALKALVPLSQSKMRRLFVATRSDWTACFQNGVQGSDPFPAMSYLSQRMGVLAMRVCSTPEALADPANIWEVYAPASLGGDKLGYRRTVAAAKDGDRWVFEQSGERYPFEQAARYAAPRYRDRFKRDMLCDYLREFGVTSLDDPFMSVSAETPAVILQQITNVQTMPEFTLEQVVAGEPWRKRS
jgi:hypothetical protein